MCPLLLAPSSADKANVNDSSALEGRADREAASGNLQLARQSLEEALRVGPVSVELWAKLGAIRRATGDLQGALAAVEQAAIQASCETRRLVGQQAQGFAVAALPLARSV